MHYRVAFVVALLLIGCSDDSDKDSAQTDKGAAQTRPDSERESAPSKPEQDTPEKAAPRGDAKEPDAPRSLLERPGELPRPPQQGKVPSELRPPR